ncbi:MAG TPA: MerR family transcriptional regulator [Chloroflexia bacterium]|nr:MerR family transcriptional regulator [Chloroflexia bacterium]
MRTKTLSARNRLVSHPDGYMQIGEVAEATGLTQRTIRYYEELGLLPAPERTQGDFRLYTAQDVHRLAEIARLKDLLGFSLADIKESVLADEAREQLKTQLLEAEDGQSLLAKLRALERLTISQLSILERKMAQMDEMKADLEARLSRYRKRIAELDLRELEGGH